MGNQPKELFRVNGVSKSYGSTKALKDVSFSINRGEIVGIVGENGAGKSTLLKIMTGVEQADSGTMVFSGNTYAPKSPKEANSLGVGMVFQEQSLITNLTVAQNIFFGEEDKFREHGFIKWSEMTRRARDILDRVAMDDIPANKKISDIQFSRRQMVEIAKVLHRASHGRESGALILLDEPTSVLSNEEIKILFGKMLDLKEAGNGVVFITHRLDEIMEVCDRIFVFKDGRNVCDMEVADASEEILYEKMVGKSSSCEYYKCDKQIPHGKNLLIDAKNIGSYGNCRDVSFTLHEGEIMGICGVVGSGKETLCGIISGDEPHTSGELRINGKVQHFSSPHKALLEKIVCVPTERRVEGQVGIASIEDNIIYSNMERITKHGFISNKMQRKIADEWIHNLNIKCQGPTQAIENLSGGNAQKVVFARVLSSDARIIVLNNPTRGVDVGAKEEIYDIIRSASARGIGIIVLGDTLDECIGLSHKILVMKDGLVTKEFDAPAFDKPEQIDIIQFMM